MFRKTGRAWYWRVLAILAVLRVIYGFARFFMKTVDRQAAREEKRIDRRSAPANRWL
jgi:hypothetical protein